jgi:Tfp pilus assembly protein PilV
MVILPSQAFHTSPATVGVRRHPRCTAAPAYDAGRRGAAGRRLRHCGGFTIVEVALAAFVMAFGIATSIVAMQTGFKALDVARSTTIASQILQSEMERLRLLPWNKDTPAGVVDSISELPASEQVDLSTMFTANAALAAKFTVTRTSVPDPARPDEVREITITVTWASYDGRLHSRTFKSLYAKNGLYDYYYTVAHPAS